MAIWEDCWRIQLKDGTYYSMMSEEECKRTLYKLQQEKAEVILIEKYKELISL